MKIWISNIDNMEQLYFFFDARYCVNCHSCRVACQTNNNTGFQINRREVTTHFNGKFPAVERFALSLACNHCERPACIKSCPEDAITKRGKDGIVYVNQEKCTFCKRCVAACPYGAPQTDELNKTISKCDFCKDKLDKNEEPFCISNCLGGALQFGTYKELTEKYDENISKEIEGFPNPELTNPSIRFGK